MAVIELTVEAYQDFERIRQFAGTTDLDAGEVVRGILRCLRVLEHTPEMGRPSAEGLRELVMLQGRAGYLALYQYNPVRDVVVVARIRHQREVGYPD